MWTLVAVTCLSSGIALAETPDAEADPSAPAAEEDAGPAAFSEEQASPGTPVKPSDREVSSGDSLGFGGPSGTPEYYVVTRGDTLWDISSKFLGNAYYWPRLWSINEQITNPHWIYPGNRIRFTLGTVLEPPDVGLDGSSGRDGYTVAGMSYEDSALACGPDVSFATTLGAATYTSLGFLADEEDVDLLGEVPRARWAGGLLSQGNLLYLKMENPDAYDCGDLLMIYRPIAKKVRHPTERGTRYGAMYRVVGEAQVVNRSGDYVSARVRTSYSEIERGDLVGPVVPTSVELEVSKPDGDVEGVIVARLNQEESGLGAPGDTVFLDRGRADGLRVGSSVYVVQNRDPVISPNKDEEGIPDSVVGRVVVVRVDEYSSTAVITDANEPIDVGARVAQRIE